MAAESSPAPAAAAAVDLSSLPADSPHEAAVLRVLAAAVAPRPASAADVADQLDQLYPAGDAAAVEDFLWALWTLLIAVAKKITADDPRQPLLVDAVARLKTRRHEPVELWGQKTTVWDDLPMLGPCMRDAWNLRPKLDGSDRDEAAVREWTSLNSLAARMFGAHLQPWVNFAIWELRAALEEPPAPALTDASTDAGVATVCEWILHAGRALHHQGRQPQKLDTMEERALMPGKLFDGGASGLSDERWRFWCQRLEDLGRHAGTPELRDRAQKAADMMKDLEAAA